MQHVDSLPSVETAFTSRLWLMAALWLTLVCSAGAQQVVLAEETTPGDHRLVSIHETTLAGSLGQQDLHFMPLQLAGDSVLHRLDPDRPQLRGASGPAPHLRLPTQGTVYIGDQPAQTRVLLVDPSGTVNGLHEFPRAPGMRSSSLLDWVAVSPDGSQLLMATRLEQGGDVFLVDTQVAGRALNLTPDLPAMTVDGESLRVGTLSAWFTAGGQLYQSRQGASASAVDLGLLPGETVVPETALSGDGKVLAALVEQAPGQRIIMRVDDAGSVSPITTDVRDYDAPGYQTPIGPLLALSQDGSCIAWRRTVVGAAKDLFVQPIQSPAALDQVTGDANFTDTLDGVGIFGFIGDGQLVFVAGEASPDPAFPLERADLFLSDSLTGGGLSNLTMTSGVPTPPFLLKGELDVGQAMLDPRGERLLLCTDPDDGDSAVVAAHLTAPYGLETVLSGLLVPAEVEAVGDDVVVFSVAEPPGPAAQMHLLPPAGDPAGLNLLATAPFPVTFDRFTTHRSGLLAACVGTLAPGTSLALQIDTLTRSLHVVWTEPMHLSPTLAFSPLGQLVVGFAGPATTTGPYLWASFPQPQQPSLLPIAPSNGFLLEN